MDGKRVTFVVREFHSSFAGTAAMDSTHPTASTAIEQARERAAHVAGIVAFQVLLDEENPEKNGKPVILFQDGHVPDSFQI